MKENKEAVKDEVFLTRGYSSVFLCIFIVKYFFFQVM